MQDNDNRLVREFVFQYSSPPKPPSPKVEGDGELSKKSNVQIKDAVDEGGEKLRVLVEKSFAGLKK